MRVKDYRGALTQAHLERMCLPERFWRVRYDGINPELREQIGIYLRSVNEWLDRGEGFLLWGENGRGKTGAMAYVAKEVRRTGASVLFVTAGGLIASVLDKNSERDVDGQTLLERATTVDFLALDDLGKEHKGANRNSSWSERVLETLLRERSAARRTTWITTNMAPRAKEGGVSGSLFDRYKTSMREVLKETVFPVQVLGDNLRDRVVTEMHERMAV